MFIKTRLECTIKTNVYKIRNFAHVSNCALRKRSKSSQQKYSFRRQKVDFRFMSSLRTLNFELIKMSFLRRHVKTSIRGLSKDFILKSL